MCPDSEIEGQEPAPYTSKKERLQSSIQFPYGDLETAISIAESMHNSGYQECAPDQLAAAMNQQASSGNFRQKVSTARAFGLVHTSPGRIAITELGYSVLDPAQQRKARVDAFLIIELYRRLYDDFRGKQLPPRPAALERAFEGYGVSPKQTAKARHAFDRSAKQAGFFDHGNDRLVIPGDIPAQSTPVAKETRDVPFEEHRGGGTGGGEIPPHLDPLIVALLHKVPTGKTWSIPDRAKWLRALAMNLSFVYESDAEDSREIEVAIQADTLESQ
jgi:hypothetical protein